MVMEAEKAKPASERVLDKWQFTNDPAQVIFYRPVIKIFMIFRFYNNLNKSLKNDQLPRCRNGFINLVYFLTLTLTRPIGLPPHAPVARKIADQR